MGAPPPLLTLRDLLELACESSCSEGFRTYPRRIPWHCDDAVQAKAEEAAAPVRLLIQAGLRRSPSRTLSSFLFPRSPRSASATAISRLTRSLSRRLVFWRRHCADDDDDDAGERDSLGLPSPVVSSCSASECSESVAHAADCLPVLEGQAPGASGEPEKPSTSTSSGCTGCVDDGGAADGDGLHKVPDGNPVASTTSMEEKQQLSPVAVMDFPFHDGEDDDDDGDERSDAGTCSPSSFQQRQPDLERSSSAHELLHKIRRLDGPAQAQAQGVDPVDLEPRFDASDESTESDDTQTQSNSSTSTDHDSTATTTSTTTLSEEQHPSSDDADAEREPGDHHHRLLARLLKDDDGTAATSVGTEWLLLDFFAEALDRRRSLKAGPVVGAVKPSDEHDELALVHAAKKWIQGTGTQWGVEDVLFAGAAALADMDRERRWMSVGVEEREVGVAVGELMMDALVAELLSDMAV